jgi:menaquinone-dependent protoporphyrinogen oxidase
MTSVLVLYWSRRGHTAKIARQIRDGAIAAGARAEAVDLRELGPTGVDWDRYDVVAIGAPVIYGTYDKPFLAFVAANRGRLEAKPSSFYNVSVVARTPEKRTVEGNRYMQKFLELSPWKPRDLKVIAGKVDYPAWHWWERFMIKQIMKYTDGPTDTTAVIDYTDWDDVAAYGRHLVTLAAGAAGAARA